MKLVKLFNQKHSPQRVVARPYIIAEAGVNHEGDMNLARKLIDEAKEGAANAIKFQTYKAKNLVVRNSPAYWDITQESTPNQFELFQKYDKFWKNEFEELKKYCDQVGIEFMSTPFDMESARFLNDLMDVYKISSSDITNKPFIQYICEFGKPIILSTGASNIDEICEAAGWIESKGNPLAFLHCILNYPTEETNANLGMILDLKKNFPENLIGYSDHTLPDDMTILEVASLLGASIIEKHFTHDKTLPGNDHYHAMDKEDLKKLNLRLDRIFELIGDGKKHSLPTEEPARINARRSLVASKKLLKGGVMKNEDLNFKRPGCGISPKDIHKVIGRKILCDIDEDSLIQWEFFDLT